MTKEEKKAQIRPTDEADADAQLRDLLQMSQNYNQKAPSLQTSSIMQTMHMQNISKIMQ